MSIVKALGDLRQAIVAGGADSYVRRVTLSSDAMARLNLELLQDLRFAEDANAVRIRPDKVEVHGIFVTSDDFE